MRAGTSLNRQSYFSRPPLAAGVAVACYSIYFATPIRMLPWPIGVGMLAHALRWVTLETSTPNVAVGAFVASIVAGSILAPVARRTHMPFAAIGFAAVVSMMPGIFLFRMMSGLIQLVDLQHINLEVFRPALDDGVTAATVILAICVGLVLPK